MREREPRKQALLRAINRAFLAGLDHCRIMLGADGTRRMLAVAEADALTVLAEAEAEIAALKQALKTLGDYGNWEHAERVPVREHEDHRQLGRTVALIWIGAENPLDVAANVLGESK